MNTIIYMIQTSTASWIKNKNKASTFWRPSITTKAWKNSVKNLPQWSSETPWWKPSNPGKKRNNFTSNVLAKPTTKEILV